MIAALSRFESLQIIDDPEARGGALNMAIDETLLRRVRSPLLRVYRWQQPAVSFGYFERYDAISQLYPHRELVRRWTGGGAVVHGEDTTYSLIVPGPAPLVDVGVNESYRWIHEALARVIAGTGVKVGLATESAPPGGLCFQHAVRSDIISSGLKIAGAAQRRSRAGLLHQGSIQNVALPQFFPRLLGRELAAAIVTRTLDSADLDVAVALSASKYATDAWLQKR